MITFNGQEKGLPTDREVIGDGCSYISYWEHMFLVAVYKNQKRNEQKRSSFELKSNLKQ
jgi:hypothetical protein